MASNLPAHFLTQFDTRVRNEYQFEGVLRYGMFYTRMGNAETFKFNKQGLVYSHEHISNSPLVLGTVDKSVVDVKVKFYDVSLTVDPVEQKQINFSEEQYLIAAAKKAMARRRDAVILEAITATTTSNVVPKDISGADAGLTLEALQETAAIMDDASIPEQGRVMLVNPRQLHNLLKNTKVTSEDFNTVKALVNGQIDTFYGFKFIKVPKFEVSQGISAGIPVDTDNEETFAYAFVASGDEACPVAVAVNTDITFQTDKIPHMGFSTLIHGLLGIGSKIIDEKGIVKVVCENI